MLLRDALNGSTRAEHEALERSLGLLRDDLGLDAYIAYLRGWLAFCRNTRRDFDAGRASWPFAADCGARIAWLEDDLAFLSQHSASSMPSIRLDIHALPELAGASYVVEGSLLGAQVLYRSLNERWHVEKHRGASFLWGYGAMSGRHWRRFLVALNDLPFTVGERERCTSAARMTFRVLAHCFHVQARGAPANDATDVIYREWQVL